MCIAAALHVCKVYCVASDKADDIIWSCFEGGEESFCLQIPFNKITLGLKVCI